MVKRRVHRFTNEDNIHARVAAYIRDNHPSVHFHTDFSSGMKMTLGQAVKHQKLQSGRGWPDIFLAEPSHFDSGFGGEKSGLFIELKRDDVKLKRTKNQTKISKHDYKIRVVGDWWNQHIEEQALVLESLERKGYIARFAIGYDEAVAIIKNYIRGDC